MKKLLTGFWFGTTAEAFEGELPLYEISTVLMDCTFCIAIFLYTQLPSRQLQHLHMGKKLPGNF